MSLKNETDEKNSAYNHSHYHNYNTFSNKCTRKYFHSKRYKTGVGIGYNEGVDEEGFGTFYTIGLERSYGKKERIRINANFILGEFTSGAIS